LPSLATEEDSVSRPSGFYQWVSTVTTHLPHLSKPQVFVLAAWSFAVVALGACGRSSVACFLAPLLDKDEEAVRQQFREWYCPASTKKGARRRELEVQSCFLPLLTWVLQWWPAEERRLALALDATTLADRFIILSITVVYRGCAIPLAWKVLPANTPGSWKRPWLRLLRALEGGIPRDWTVIVLADRGLYARWLFRYLHRRLRWHPFLRINAQGLYRRRQGKAFQSLSQLLPAPGMRWCGRVVCFKAQPLACTLLGCWEAEAAEPWLILTDLLPQQADVAWYALRAWIECGFKDFKRGGWQWQHTRMQDPQRAERLWLVLAVATLWAVSVGGEVETTLSASGLDDLPLISIPRGRPRLTALPRLLSCFRRGRIVLVAALICGQALPMGRFHPEPWPAASPPSFAQETYP
jgi:hypothetical protein